MRASKTARYLLLTGLILSVANLAGEARAQLAAAKLDSSSDFFCYYAYFNEGPDEKA